MTSYLFIMQFLGQQLTLLHGLNDLNNLQQFCVSFVRLFSTQAIFEKHTISGPVT
jgi:hypothetical protein